MVQNFDSTLNQDAHDKFVACWLYLYPEKGSHE